MTISSESAGETKRIATSARTAEAAVDYVAPDERLAIELRAAARRHADFLNRIETDPDAFVPRSSWGTKLKRPTDIIVASILLVILTPLLLLCMLLVKLDSAGAAIFCQMRVGRDRRRRRHDPSAETKSPTGAERRRFDLGGQPFTLRKLRSMRADAEKGGAVWALEKGDPRVTRMGRILRKTHLDEMPQLWSVVKGEMSLVGPRPERPEFIEKIAVAIPAYRCRCKVRPGITGLAQIKVGYDQNAEDVVNKLRHDLVYVETMGFRNDLKIAWWTIAQLFTGPKDSNGDERADDRR
jgi:lipopolysaccharide/colanic/teichoic acid biosynthesis glycosyltransferase